MAKRWQQEHPGEERCFEALQIHSPKLPEQDNLCDCGLFVCAFTEFFLEAMPPALNLGAVYTLGEQFEEDGCDLWESPKPPMTEVIDLTLTENIAISDVGIVHVPRIFYPGFLTPYWFPFENAGTAVGDFSYGAHTHGGK